MILVFSGRDLVYFHLLKERHELFNGYVLHDYNFVPLGLLVAIRHKAKLTGNLGSHVLTSNGNDVRFRVPIVSYLHAGKLLAKPFGSFLQNKDLLFPAIGAVLTRIIHTAMALAPERLPIRVKSSS